MGNRPDELRALLDSVAKQDGDPVEVVVVGNGAPLPDVPEGVRTVELPENLGIPGGRNVGIEAFGPSGTDVDVLLFLDDDGLLPSSDTAELVREAFAADPGWASSASGSPTRTPGETQRRHVPAAARRRPDALLPGHHLPRRRQRRTYEGLRRGRRPARTSSSTPTRRPTSPGGPWTRAGRSTTASDMVLHHPTTAPTRHAVYHRMVARNRVWLARRNLPAPLVPVYLGVWLLLTLARRPSRPALQAWFGGFKEGWTTPCGPRRPMRWRTVWRLTRLGRPPVI